MQLDTLKQSIKDGALNVSVDYFYDVFVFLKNVNVLDCHSCCSKGCSVEGMIFQQARKTGRKESLKCPISCSEGCSASSSRT